MKTVRSMKTSQKFLEDPESCFPDFDVKNIISGQFDDLLIFIVNFSSFFTLMTRIKIYTVKLIIT